MKNALKCEHMLRSAPCTYMQIRDCPMHETLISWYPIPMVKALPAEFLDCDFNSLPFTYHLGTAVASGAVHAIRP